MIITINFNYSATSHIVSIPSKAMNRSFKATIILSDSYKKTKKQYSVIYFLHGYSGNYSIWPKVAPLEKYCDMYQLIFVCPDGYYNSWYINSPKKSGSKFETYIANEVIESIDKDYRTFKSSKARAIIGSSMGGHGAIMIALKYPDKFIGGCGISGIMDLTEFPTNWDIKTVLGDYSKNQELWKINSVFYFIDSLQSISNHIILDCGINDFALKGNRKTHNKLIKLEVDHDYHEHPGGHTPEYIRKCVEEHILAFKKILQQ